MTFRVVFFGPAEADLDAIYTYIAERASPAVAVRFVERLEAYCQALADMPERGTRRDDLRPGLRTLAFRRRATILFEVEAASRTVVIHGIHYAGRSFEPEPDPGD